MGAGSVRSGRSSSSRVSTLCWALVGASLALACGNISGGDEEEGPRAGTGGGRSGAGGAPMSMGGRGGAGGASPEDAGATPRDDDAGSGGAVGGGSVGGGAGTASVPPGCPEPTPIPARPAQTVAIQSIHFDRSEVVLRNVSNMAQTIVGGRQGWQWCNVPGYFNIVLTDEDVVLAPGGTYRFRLQERSGENRPLYHGEDSADTNELGIYITTGAFNNSELIEAFVSWGAGSDRETRESVANMADIWIYGDRVAIQPGHAGFVATGDAKRGAGFTSVPARCLPP